MQTVDTGLPFPCTHTLIRSLGTRLVLNNNYVVLSKELKALKLKAKNLIIVQSSAILDRSYNLTKDSVSNYCLFKVHLINNYISDLGSYRNIALNQLLNLVNKLEFHTRTKDQAMR